MSLGTRVRHLLGRWEGPAAELYRRPFINLDDLGVALATLSSVQSILEVGAGEGAVATRLVRAFPRARYLGMDLIPEPGRLFVGDASRVEFRSGPVEDLAAELLFDLVVLVDVLHHVPAGMCGPLLAAAARHVRRGGYLAVKEWERNRSPMQFVWLVTDRYIGGDRNVHPFAPGEARALVAETCPGFSLLIDGRVPPRRNNILLVAERDAC
ncbi:MAG: methyltransferase domain-containing protein [Candidatus Dormibacteria bacterium]